MCVHNSHYISTVLNLKDFWITVVLTAYHKSFLSILIWKKMLVKLANYDVVFIDKIDTFNQSILSLNIEKTVADYLNFSYYDSLRQTWRIEENN